MIKQKHWRIAGLALLAICAGMVWYGADAPWIRQRLLYFLGYWGFFLVCFLLVGYCVVLDLRYIRMTYAIAKREIYRQTVGDENFQRALLEAANRREHEESEPGKRN